MDSKRSWERLGIKAPFCSNNSKFVPMKRCEDFSQISRLASMKNVFLLYIWWLEVRADTLAAVPLPPWYTSHVSMISICDSGERIEAVLSCVKIAGPSLVEGVAINTLAYTHSMDMDVPRHTLWRMQWRNAH